ncbi:PIN domain nuclease of toxin-antitoxin system [Silvibacterium bohemicum]|uniref:PIN domain nuclease of toxin-antitoxin system n=1 Tax=Silvibacterium bohemicum TaxID=1577686 RepID=A0A841JRB8_9BACT|nr:type II toxin-antitoxin system VapC family toxin [Silvibacterium bohemicum]MBB6143953.1 PIN domain nuclease of toxin-antitoxin system [Silvibacterium bohemicum]
MILIDTHVVLWLALHPDRVSTRAAETIAQTRELKAEILVSTVSLYEIAVASTRNRIELDVTLPAFLQRVREFFRIREIDHRIAIAAAGFMPPFPGDPMDRIIAATALTEGIPLVTADERIRRSGVVNTIW